MLEIPVELGLRRYTVSVGRGLVRRLPERLSAFRGRRIVLVASRRVFALHGRAVEKGLRSLGPLEVTLVPDGERFKGPTTLEGLYEAFLAALRSGMPPAAGIALGFDRLVALLLGATGLDEITAFP